MRFNPLLSSSRANPAFVELFENLYVGEAGVREKRVMLLRRKQIHVRGEMFVENLFPNTFQMFSAAVNLGDDQQRAARS